MALILFFILPMLAITVLAAFCLGGVVGLATLALAITYVGTAATLIYLAKTTR